MAEDKFAKRPFMTVTLDKGRFTEEGGIPLAVLGKLAAIEGAVREMARHVFFEDHPDKKHVRDGFDEQFRLVIRSLTTGSQSLAIDRWSPIYGEEGKRDDDAPDGAVEQDEYDLAALRLVEVGEAARQEDGTVAGPRGSLAKFGRFLSLLEGDEVVDFIVQSQEPGAAPAVRCLDRRAARRVELAAAMSADPKEEPYNAVGVVERVLFDKRQARIRKRETGRCVLVPTTADSEALLGDIASDGRTDLVRVVGTVRRNADGDLAGFVGDLTFSRIGGPSLAARLVELEKLQDGWLDGAGKAPRPVLFRRAADIAWTIVERLGLSRPYVYPTPDGGLQFEWDLDGDRGLEVTVRHIRNGWEAAVLADWLDEDDDAELPRFTKMPNLLDWLTRAIAVDEDDVDGD